jgi:hypothetical protein
MRPVASHSRPSAVNALHAQFMRFSQAPAPAPPQPDSDKVQSFGNHTHIGLVGFLEFLTLADIVPRLTSSVVASGLYHCVSRDRAAAGLNEHIGSLGWVGFQQCVGMVAALSGQTQVLGSDAVHLINASGVKQLGTLAYPELFLPIPIFPSEVARQECDKGAHAAFLAHFATQQMFDHFSSLDPSETRGMTLQNAVAGIRELKTNPTFITPSVVAQEFRNALGVSTTSPRAKADGPNELRIGFEQFRNMMSAISLRIGPYLLVRTICFSLAAHEAGQNLLSRSPVYLNRSPVTPSSRRAQARAAIEPLTVFPDSPTSNGDSPSRRIVTTPPGGIRTTDSRVRPASASFQNIGFFGVHAPGHLTSPSRRPNSPATESPIQRKPYALAPYGVHLEDINQTVTPPLDVPLIAEKQKKSTYKAVNALSSHNKAELRKLFDEGIVLLRALPEGLAAEICAAACANEATKANPLASIISDEIQSLRLSSKLIGSRREEDKRLLLANLRLLIRQGAKLLEQVDQTLVRKSYVHVSSSEQQLLSTCEDDSHVVAGHVQGFCSVHLIKILA